MTGSGYEMQSYGSMEAMQADLNKKFGKNTILRGDEYINNSVIETGIFALDYALCGGIPEAQMTMFIGYEQSGKTTNSIRTGGNAIRKYDDPSKVAFYCDIEGTMDTVWADMLGMPIDKLWIANSVLGEEALDTMISAAEEPQVAFMVMDSIPSIISKKEMDKSAFDATMGIRAQLLSRFLGKMNAITTRRRLEGNPLTFVMINQWREALGVMFGDNKVVPGGKAPKHYAHTMVEFKLKKEETGKDDEGIDSVETNQHQFKLIKFKGPKNIKVAEFDMIRNYENELPLGTIDDYQTVIGYAKKHGLLTGGGNSWKIDGIESKFPNAEGVRRYLIENDEAFRMLKAQLIILRRIHFNLPALPPDQYLYGWHDDDSDVPVAESVQTFGQTETSEEADSVEAT